ncbi:TetR/AcrR family transcriptional regulator [Actinomadura formosensis]|uniref:TetR/AcrR family transcriptional regulator n=1 Tax=Actinomadura formosensis TaxID=60706 RepID=UPI0008328A24|nr:TetR/AcrR family transcriptional regulator [Actinomadura formosensis]
MAPETTPEVDMKAEILAAASELFQRDGYSKTKVAAIARAVGITPPTLYWHFESKEDILFEFLRTGLEAFLERIEAATAGLTDPAEALRALAVAHTRAQLSQRERAQTFLSMTYSPTQLASSLPKDRYELIRELHRRHYENTRAILRAGAEQGVFDVPDLSATTFAILNICEYSALWFQPGGPLTVDQVAEMHGEFALRIATSPPEPRKE